MNSWGSTSCLYRVRFTEWTVGCEKQKTSSSVGTEKSEEGCDDWNNYSLQPWVEEKHPSDIGFLERQPRTGIWANLAQVETLEIFFSAGIQELDER